MKPRASTDENTTNKPVGTIVAIGSAGIRIVSVVSISTDRSNSHRPNADSNSHLCLRICQRYHQYRQQCYVFQITHNHLLLLIRSPLPVQKLLQHLYSFERKGGEKVAEIGLPI